MTSFRSGQGLVFRSGPGKGGAGGGDGEGEGSSPVRQAWIVRSRTTFPGPARRPPCQHRERHPVCFNIIIMYFRQGILLEKIRLIWYQLGC